MQKALPISSQRETFINREKKLTLYDRYAKVQLRSLNSEGLGEIGDGEDLELG